MVKYKLAGRRTTRSASLAERVHVRTMSTERRDHYVDAIRRAGEQLTEEAIAAMPRLDLEDRLLMLEASWRHYEEEHLTLRANPALVQHREAHLQLYVELEEAYLQIRRVVRQRTENLRAEERRAEMILLQNQQQLPQQAQQIVVQTADALANIPNTWGTFSGDFAQWHSFRDRFTTAVHANNKIPITFKFQYLTSAVTGRAAKVMGTYKLTDENYARAWERLCDVYEDDYTAIQTLVRRVLNIPRMDRPTNAGLRRITDTIHECLTQLDSFFNVQEWHPLIMFSIVDCMDSITFDAWETQRINLAEEEAKAKLQALANQIHVQDDVHVVDDDSVEGSIAGAAGGVPQRRKPVNLPSLTVLLKFLESRAGICARSERRARDDSSDVSSTNKNRDGTINRSRPKLRSVVVPVGSQKPATSASNTRGAATGYPPCTLCEQDHALYRCPDFLALNLNGRRDHVKRFKLCRNCLRNDHDEKQCKNKPCYRCPNNQPHNSVLCPTREVEKQSASLAAANLVQEQAATKQAAKRQSSNSSEQ